MRRQRGTVVSIIAIFTTLLLIVPLWPGVSVQAEESDDSSIIADFANKVFDVELTDGSGIFDSQADIDRREKYNNLIIQDQMDQKISLYDRFGGNIKFVPYFGEKKFKIGMPDKIYSNIKQNNGDFVIDVQDIFKKSGAVINNAVYEGRPDIISEENVEAGMVDPRYSAYSGVSSSGGEAALGNFYLTYAKIVTEIVTYIAGSGIFRSVDSAWEMATSSSLFELFSNMVKNVLPLAVVFFVFFLFRSILRMLKGQQSIGDVLIKTLSFMISVGLIFSILANPNILRPLTTKVVLAIDDLFAQVLSEEASAPEVAQSSDNRYVLQATIWSKTVLDPWAKGMFDGRKYNELYTQFSDKPKSKKMPQSNDNIMTEWDDGEIRYGSATLTGDVKVPIGGDEVVQNWAALAWSTQSIYHIDAVNASSEEVEEEQEAGTSLLSWPKAERTPNNNQIYVDSFRWLDAKLNISPGYISPEHHDGNYKESRPYEVSFISSGINAAFLATLLVPILFPAIRKLVALIKVITASVRWMYMSIMSIIKPEDNEFSLVSNLKNVFKPLYFYFWWSMTIYIMFFLYMKLVGNGILGDVVWLALAIVIIRFKPVSNMKVLRDMKYAAKNLFTNKGRL